MRRRRHLPSFLPLVALLVAVPAAAIEGVVKNTDGEAIAGARVQSVDGGETAFSDADGRFRLELGDEPARILVAHPRYGAVEVDVPAAPAPEVEIVLVPKQLVYEEVVVSASRGEGDAGPVSIAATLIEPDDLVSPPATLTELVSVVPGVSENGQGGIFQTYSVRGVSRQRVLTLVAGMRIVGERRAGVSASFLDPLLVGSVDVLRGPSSTYYGSGALGGVIQLFPKSYDRLTVESGYRTEGDTTFTRLGWGDRGWSLGLAHRRAGDAETPDGRRLNSGFRQLSTAIERNWTALGRDWTLDLLGSRGSDIGKSNSDFPERSTIYPEENHLLVRLAVGSADGWRFEAYAHPNDLETEVTEGSALNRVDNSALDYGLNLRRESALGENALARYGADLFGRHGVTATEIEAEGDGPPVRLETLDDATEREAGLYGAVERRWGRATVLAGGRFALQQQKNGGGPSADETAWSGFGGLVAPLPGGVELVANVGSGLRFPSLSERFFSGTTGRGGVIGNPALAAERSLNADVGVRWYGRRLFLSGYLFRNEIDDYIERIEIAPDLRTFVNLTEGTIEGVELDGFYRPGGSWDLRFGAHAIEGRDAAGEPLADVPVDRVYLGAGGAKGRWGWNGRIERRSAKDDPGSGEQTTPAADLLSLAASFRLRPGLELRLEGKNLLDESYLNSADRRTELSPGRSFGLSVAWRREG